MGRKNDLRLISTCVIPEVFGPYAQIDWAHPDAAFDELDRLIAESPAPRALHNACWQRSFGARVEDTRVGPPVGVSRLRASAPDLRLPVSQREVWSPEGFA